MVVRDQDTRMDLAHADFATRPGARRAMLMAVLASPMTWTLLALGVLLAANQALDGPGLAGSLGDTDDAVRLYTVRELLSGATFFDTTLARIGAPEALVSHWSRLVDLPLAALMRFFEIFTSPSNAELLTRAIWPPVLFAGLAFGFTREARRQGGPWASALAMALVVMCAISMVQFRPGRIDHHNVQILCAVMGVLLLARSLREPEAGWWAGLSIGLGLAVGFESIALVVPMLALAGLMSVLSPAAAAGGLNAVLATAGTLLLSLLATTAPHSLLHVHCDALSLNLVVLSLCCAAGLAAVSVLRGPRLARLAIAGAGAVLGGAAYAALEPACLAGPFGQVNPAIKPIWLDHVVETQSFLQFTLGHPDAGLPQLVVIAAGVIAHLMLARSARTTTTMFGCAGTLLAVLLGLWQIKLMPYAVWLSIMPIAVLTAQALRDPQRRTLALRALIVLLAAISLIDVAAKPFLPPASGVETANNTARRVCERTPNVEKLSALPAGLVAADIGLGAFIATLTRHRVVAAPYHRIDKGILALHWIMKSPPDAARSLVQQLGVTYLAICTSMDGAPAKDATPANELRALLANGRNVPWLEPVPLDLKSLRVWRVRPVAAGS